MATVRVQEADFDIGAEIAALTAGRTDIGGIGCFIGTVRETGGRETGGRETGGDAPVRTMTLEHYPGMTERAMTAIAAEAERRWSLLGVTLVHRVGRLSPGANIVLVIAAAAHRQAALDATAFLIDWLKTKAPFWKKEVRAGVGEVWVEARDIDDVAAGRWDAPR